MSFIFFISLIHIVLGSGLFSSDVVNDQVANLLEVKLDATWYTIPFKLSYLESIASHNNTLFVPAVERIIGCDEGSDYDEESEIQLDKSDAELYQDIIDHLKIDDINKDFINFNLATKRFNPRVEAHYKHYQDIKDTYSKRLAKECSSDSFGNQISLDGSVPQAWIVYNDKLYCSSDDLYALKTDNKISDTLLPFDRVIGDNNESPLLILYGNVESVHFKNMFVKLIENAQYGKIRFVWRYIPSAESNSFENLCGYGADLTIKNSENLVSDEKVNDNLVLSLEDDFDRILESTKIFPIEKDEIDSLGVKLMSFILRNDSNAMDLLNTILQDFPKFAPYIGNYNPENLKEIESVVKDNENIGISEESYGLYVNGSPINNLELDVFTLINKIISELRIIRELEVLGFTSEQAKIMIAKFALISAVKNAQFEKGNNIMGSNENRYRIFEDEFIQRSKRNAVVFMNDIENDQTYYQYSDDRDEVYSDFSLRRHPNQIPPLRENIYDLIFALNFSDKAQLKVFFTFAKLILDNGIPQQLGIMSLPSDGVRDLELAKRFYFLSDITDRKEALAFLYKYLESTDDEGYYELLKSVQIPTDYEYDEQLFRNTAMKYSISQPSVIVNGVIHELATTNWQMHVRNQIAQDIKLIQLYISTGNGKNMNLKHMLYEGSKSERNLRIIPSNLNSILYKKINMELIAESTVFTKYDEIESISGSFWLIGDFNEEMVVQQLIHILQVILTSSKALQVRIINTGNESLLVQNIKSVLLTDKINETNVANIKLWYNQTTFPSESVAKNGTVVNLLERNELPIHHSYVLFNSRYLRLFDILTPADLQLLVEYEFNQRLSIFPDIITIQEKYFDSKSMKDISNLNSFIDWLDLLTSVVTNSFYSFDSLFVNDVFRYDFTPISSQKSLYFKDYNSELPIDILFILDPISEYTQKVLAILTVIKQFSFLNIRIILQPKLDYNKELMIKRFYRGVYPLSYPSFELNGSFLSNYSANFKNLPIENTMTTDLDLPQRWISVIKNCPSTADLDNIYFSNDIKSFISGTYELKNILIEGYARDVQFAKSPKNLTLELFNKHESFNTRLSNNLGYFQFKGNPGLWNLRNALYDSSNYSLLSATEKKVSSNRTPLESVEIAITDLSGHVILPRFTSEKLKKASTKGKFGMMKNIFNVNKVSRKLKPEAADINIFTIASGHTYERLMAIMTASIREHSNSSIKFWFIENYLSPKFKDLLLVMAEKYNFDYEFISYKWPNWLRTQREKHRTIWGYKILFLDLLFPQNLSRVIFVDADQIARTDMKDLMEIDLEGAVYGYTPMCDSNKDMEGFMFWKRDYWSKVLQNDLKYHISAMFVVDLDRFRQLDTGDILRSHYQKLSSDSNSLANLDQDLPNNLQRKVKIFSLPQEWLWCETWCSSDSLKSAKLIDLCNNPLTRESKVEVAKRLIPEWTTYDNEISHLVQERDRLHAKLEQSESITTINPQETHPTDTIDDFGDEEEYHHDEL